MMMQTGKYWMSDYLSLLTALIDAIYVSTVSEFYQDKVMFHFVCYSFKNRGKQPVFIVVFLKMAGGR